MRFLQFLKESQIINLSKKAFASLSYRAKEAIEGWEYYDFKTGGVLEKSVLSNDEVAQEIAKAMEPVKAAIKGQKIKLYRGISIGNDTGTYWHGRKLESWTDNRSVAEYFAGQRTQQNKNGRFRIEKLLTKQEIDAMVAKYEKTGFLQFGNKKYARNKEVPQYYNIFQGKELITDGDNIRRELESINDWRDETNKKIEAKSKVLERVFDVDDIIWVTNNLNSKEYIVRVK